MAVRSILISGANQGLGMHTVHQLAATKDVLIFMGSRILSNAETAIAGFASDIHPSSTVIPVQLDITDPTSISNAVEFIKKYLHEKGRTGLDVLMNNAVSGSPSLPTSFAVNVFGAHDLKQAVRPILNKGGAILNISSQGGSLTLLTHRPPIPVFPAYNTSKSGLNSMTLQWAIEEEGKVSGVRVVSIDPGFNATALTKDTTQSGAGDPRDGCKIMVEAALATEGKSGVFITKDGEVPW
ncbi:short-chain dehydrogenase/reductase family protein [Favolaschia claudopus]|uniref:Short-chain dehydrogenase/reductase family protein n=1 Tax=Favolaschia claudopus TaxID=2862362 RepID=A0AAW0BF30_9AGAR